LTDSGGSRIVVGVRPGCPFLLFLSTAACASTVSSRDPFAGGRSSRGGNRPAVRVGLEVVCDQCLITFVAGAERGSTRPAQRTMGGDQDMMLCASTVIPVPEDDEAQSGGSCGPS
jgi:hypothetical protein